MSCAPPGLSLLLAFLVLSVMCFLWSRPGWFSLPPRRAFQPRRWPATSKSAPGLSPFYPPGELDDEMSLREAENTGFDPEH